MPSPLTLAALALAAHLPAAPAVRGADADWAAIVRYDEVRVDLDTTRVAGQGGGAVRAWVRWHFLDRASSPAAWDAGVRTSLDHLEVDCARGATRTLSSSAFDGEGAFAPGQSSDVPLAAWASPRAGTVGAEVVAGICGVAAARGGVARG